MGTFLLRIDQMEGFLSSEQEENRTSSRIEVSQGTSAPQELEPQSQGTTASSVVDPNTPVVSFLGEQQQYLMSSRQNSPRNSAATAVAGEGDAGSESVRGLQKSGATEIKSSVATVLPAGRTNTTIARTKVIPNTVILQEDDYTNGRVSAAAAGTSNDLRRLTLMSTETPFQSKADETAAAQASANTVALVQDIWTPADAVINGELEEKKLELTRSAVLQQLRDLQQKKIVNDEKVISDVKARIAIPSEAVEPHMIFQDGMRLTYIHPETGEKLRRPASPERKIRDRDGDRKWIKFEEDYSIQITANYNNCNEELFVDGKKRTVSIPGACFLPKKAPRINSRLFTFRRDMLLPTWVNQFSVLWEKRRKSLAHLEEMLDALELAPEVLQRASNFHANTSKVNYTDLDFAKLPLQHSNHRDEKEGRLLDRR
ncbi:unnamed protein product [Amoebophrya sp. A120]|nr:unnamed protein product [Amoebophrya sp. A120]|eukprot:GSA120T00000652001.1